MRGLGTLDRETAIRMAVTGPNIRASGVPLDFRRAHPYSVFPELAKAPLATTEFCNYENSPDGNLIIERLPNTKNVWVLGGGSGHGFKLSPALGEMAAQQIVLGKDAPKAFRLNPARDTTKPQTQFERKQ